MSVFFMRLGWALKISVAGLSAEAVPARTYLRKRSALASCAGSSSRTPFRDHDTFFAIPPGTGVEESLSHHCSAMDLSECAGPDAIDVALRVLIAVPWPRLSGG
jgi:hypothetical protein